MLDTVDGGGGRCGIPQVGNEELVRLGWRELVVLDVYPADPAPLDLEAFH
jgi:hypothetical protein